jgi:hypothetical protein
MPLLTVENVILLVRLCSCANVSVHRSSKWPWMADRVTEINSKLQIILIKALSFFVIVKKRPQKGKPNKCVHFHFTIHIPIYCVYFLFSRASFGIIGFLSLYEMIIESINVILLTFNLLFYNFILINFDDF